VAEASEARAMGEPIRILTAVPLCDGHDSAISTVNLELIRHGVEVVYLGYHRSVRDIVRAAVQEDARAVGISSYTGGHVEFFSAVVAGLRAAGAADVGVFGGGGGTITARDAATMRRRGVDRIFWPGESLDGIVGYVKTRFAGTRARPAKGAAADWVLARALTNAEERAGGAGHSANGLRPSPPRPGAGGKARGGRGLRR
jgi:methylmalonyl-CoA mutase